MRILLLSAYDAASHRRWRELLQRSFGDYHWTVMTLPPRYFSWRQRGNSLSWAFTVRRQLEADYDLLIATSMVDLSALRGFVPALGRVPSLVYFHENQFAYPRTARQFPSVEPQLLNLYTALCADRVLFNSDYNRRTLLEGAAALLAKFPDAVPEHLPQRIAANSEVVPVPLESECYSERRPGWRGPPEILWNHRWEYDKGPDRLLALMQAMEERQLPAIWHVVGQQFRSCPAQFGAIQELLACSATQRAGHWGYIDNVAHYRQLLRSADIALSTALHDFQGLAVLEAVAAGCQPLVPDRLCYGEWFDSCFRYASHPEDLCAEAASAADCLAALQRRSSPLPATDLTWLAIDRLREDYRRVFEQVAGQWPSAR